MDDPAASDHEVPHEEGPGHPDASGMELIVTTTDRGGVELQERAEAEAARLGLRYVPRRKRSMAAITPTGAAALVFTVDQGIQLVRGDEVLRHHLGTAFIRLGALDRGESDPLVRAARLQPGDRVLDATMGLARDAAVAARSIGPTGVVHGLEASLAIHTIVSEGLRIAPTDPRSAPITTEHIDARDHIARLADDSYDVVLVDPMFTTPKLAEHGFDLLRTFADRSPLTESWVREARRVAARCVVVKAARPEPWFAAAGLQPVTTAGPARWFSAVAAAG